MRIDPKIKKDFNLSGEQLEFMEMLRREAEDVPVPLALEPNMIKQRLPSKQKTPAWKVLSPIMAAAVACFAIIVVGQQTLWNMGDPGISSDPPGVTGTIDKPQTTSPVGPSREPETPDYDTQGPSEQSSIPSQGGEGSTGQASGNHSALPQVPPSDTDSETSNRPPSNPGSVVSPNGGDSAIGEGTASALEYGDVYQKIQELNGKNPAQVKGVARAANFSAIFGNNPLLMSARQTDTGSRTDTAQFDGKYIYSISEDLATGNQSVVISQVDGNNYRMAAELFVDFGMEKDGNYDFTDIRLLNCYVSQGRLTVVGSASYQQPGSKADSYSPNMLTAVATYDISNPGRPILISNSYQDGVLLSSRVSGGFLYLVTRKTVSNPAEENLQSYLPFQKTGGEYQTVGRDDIHISQYAESPCYIVASSILLKEPGTFYDTMAILGDSSELYIDEYNVYLADYIYKNGDTYTTVVKSSFGKGNFEYVGETALLGRLFDSEAIDEYQGVLRVITTCGDDNILYTLDQRLQRIGTLDNIASGLKIKSIQFNKEKVYFVTTDEPDQVNVINVADPSQPIESKKLGLPNHTMPMVPFGEGQMANLEIKQGENSGLNLSLYDMLSPSRVIETASALAVEGDVYSESIDNRQALLTIPGRGLIGFSYIKYDGAKDESGCYYALYQLSEQGVTKKVEYRHPSKVYNQRGFVKDNVLYVASSNSLIAFNIDNGKMLWEIKY
ncbi:beta-propeller domain-containing protein [Fumia xinanensis]|uniref:Beta-propeller domain-containing protein n=1 Tax=Fumia xinanensis TaxID=2763659 RepID=A0A926I3Q2_9FIRM|nr:beta-propeller domain-containing protein [Fumia xinanensis]